MNPLELLPLKWRNGRRLHFVIGTVFTLIDLNLAALGGNMLWWFAPVVNFIGVLALALAHEEAPRDDGTTWFDFRDPIGRIRLFSRAFWNGGFDVLSFLPTPTLWLLLWGILTWR